jgi:hypothetical protein
MMTMMTMMTMMMMMEMEVARSLSVNMGRVRCISSISSSSDDNYPDGDIHGSYDDDGSDDDNDCDDDDDCDTDTDTDTDDDNDNDNDDDNDDVYLLSAPVCRAADTFLCFCLRDDPPPARPSCDM